MEVIKLYSIDEIDKKTIYVYGAGMVAELLIEEVKNYSSISIVALVVSRCPADLNPIKNVPVISVKEIDKKIPVVIATFSDVHEVIGETLCQNGIDHFYIVSDRMFQQMRRHFVPAQRDIASARMRFDLMKKMSGYNRFSGLVISDDVHFSEIKNVKRMLSKEFLEAVNREMFYGSIYIYQINWDDGWQQTIKKSFEISDRVFISYRYKFLKIKNFSLMKVAKKAGFQLSDQRRIYRKREDYYPEDVIFFFEKRKPTSILKDKLCVGCGYCVENCPTSALTLREDLYGYLKPHCNKEKCVNCNKCIMECPVYMDRDVAKKSLPKCHVFQASDQMRQQSSSGGFFGTVAEYLLLHGGYVCGAAWNKDFTVSHILIHEVADLPKLQKSKYVRSDICSVLKDIKKIIENKNYILFVGCPCQVAAVKKFIGESAFLLTIDLVCTEAPSFKVFKYYLRENYTLENILSIEFRNKDNGWRADALKILQKNEKETLVHMSDPSQTAFHGRMMMALSCEHCNYASLDRKGDLSIGDAWGVPEHAPELDDSRGTSIVLVNSEKGNRLYDEIKKKAILDKEIPIEWTFQNRVIDSVSPHVRRDRFYKELFEIGFNKATRDANKNYYDIGIVGNWSYPNYGSELTYYALYRTIKEMGYSVLMIEWAEDSIWKPYGVASLFENQPYDWTEIAEPIKNHSEFYALNERCGMFVQGSDQLLSPYLYEVFGQNVMLDWVDFDKKKIAYAMSFGHEKTEYKLDDQRTISFGLSLFDAVSVREDSAVDLMRQLFGVESEQVMDPVFLQDAEFYRKIATDDSGVDNSLFAYVLDPTESTVNIIKQFANKNGLELGIVSDAARNVHGIEAGIIKSGISVEEWLAGIINSRFVITDSFHGMCIAIICRKNFVAVSNKNRGEERFRSILKKLALENRMIVNISQLNKRDYYSEFINYEEVHSIILKEKERSLRWLKNALGSEHINKVPKEYIYMQDKLRQLETRMYDRK